MMMPRRPGSPGWTRVRLARVVLPIYLLGIYATLGSVRALANFLRDAGLLRVAVLVAFVLVAAIVVAAMLRDPAARTWRTGAAIALIVAAYAGVTLPMASPEEKLHFIQYGVVGVLAFAAAPQALTELWRYVGSALFVLAAGWLDEGIQAVLPNRYYDLRDVGFNAAAGVMALSALALFRWVSRGAPASPVPVRARAEE